MPLKLRGSTWWWDGYVDGKRQRVSLRTDDAREARKRATEIERAALLGRFIAPERPSLTLRAAYDSAWALREGWRGSKSHATIANTFRHLCAEWGEQVALEGIGQEQVEAYTVKLVRAGVSPSQINARLSMLSVLRRQARLPALVMPRRTPNKPRSRIFTDAEMDRIEDAAEGPMLSLLVLLRETGARLSELLGAQPQHLSGGVLTFPDTKSGYARSVPLTRAAQRVAVFPLGITFDQAQHGWQRLRESLALGDDAVMHTYRHTLATRLVASHGPALAAAWLGHRSTRTTAGYTHLDVRHLVPLAQALEGAQIGPVPGALDRAGVMVGLENQGLGVARGTRTLDHWNHNPGETLALPVVVPK